MPSPIYSLLAYLGTLPFIASAALLAFGVESLPLLRNVLHIVEIYGLVIASFMAGVHWGQALSATTPPPIPLFLSSNIAALTLWGMYLWGTGIAFVWVLVAVFIALLWVDHRLHLKGMLSAGYYALRLRVTGIVCLALLVIGVSI